MAIPEIEEPPILPETEIVKDIKKGSGHDSAAEIRKLFANINSPSIFLFQIGTGETKRIFGGYASQSWNNPGPYFGTDSSFLFVMIKNGDKYKLRVNQNPKNGKKCILWHNNNNSLSFGLTDLVLGEDVVHIDLATLDI